LKAIFERRSIRKYTEEPVSDDDLNILLKAAMAAPSAGNRQSWEFIIIRDSEVLNAMIDYHPSGGYNMLGHAPLAIVVCGDAKKEMYESLWIQDCSAATENILIAAQSLGLGAVWLGVHPMEDRIAKIKKLLGLPEKIIPLSVVSVGHPAEKKGPSKRFDKDRIHMNKW
jgi:nitroreductase